MRIISVTKLVYALVLVLSLGFGISNVRAEDTQVVGEPGRESDEPNPLNNLYFGEQHLHTVNSPDAFAFGTRNTPDDAIRYCKGEKIKLHTTGETHQKKTPYDWCAVTDHAE